MQKPGALRVRRPFYGYGTNLRLLSKFNHKGDTHELVSVIDCRLGMDSCLKVSVPIEEIGQRGFGDRNPARIVRIFIRQVGNLKQTRVTEVLDSFRKTDNTEIIRRLQQEIDAESVDLGNDVDTDLGKVTSFFQSPSARSNLGLR